MEEGEKLEQLFGHKAHLKILLLYHKNSELIANITKLSKTIGMSHITTKHAVNDLVDAGVLYRLNAGSSRIIRVADTVQAHLVFEFINKINDVDAFTEEEMRSYSKLEIVKAENIFLETKMKVQKAEIKRLKEECERRRGPIKIKDALKQCHFSPHYKLVYESLQSNAGRLQGMYQAYCTLCKSRSIKPLAESSMSNYISRLVKDGKIVSIEGRYIVKGQTRIVEERSRG